jgi:sulfhydrogenase subunit beta (sulfur reductase)
LPLSAPTHIQLEERKLNREKLITKIAALNAENRFMPEGMNPLDFKANLKARQRDPLWEKHCATCVTCGACTHACPTCHCFILVDIPIGEKYPKMKYWDSCQYTGYARVAGGANPKKERFQRFQNRYYCKLDFKPENFQVLACTGCGRCIAACQGKIDIRKVLRDFTSTRKTHE